MEYIVESFVTKSKAVDMYQGDMLYFRLVTGGVSIAGLLFCIFILNDNAHKSLLLVLFSIVLIIVIMSTPIKIHIAAKGAAKQHWDRGVKITINDAGITVMYNDPVTERDFSYFPYSELSSIENYHRYSLVKFINRKGSIPLITSDFVKGDPYECYAFINAKLAIRPRKVY